MWPYPWTHVGTPSHPGHMDRVAATMPSQAHAGAAQEAPDIGQWEGQDVPLVRPSSCNVKGGIPSSRRYLPTYLSVLSTFSLLGLPSPASTQRTPRSAPGASLGRAHEGPSPRCGGRGQVLLCYHKEGPYQDRPLLFPFRHSPSLPGSCSSPGSAFSHKKKEKGSFTQTLIPCNTQLPSTIQSNPHCGLPFNTPVVSRCTRRHGGGHVQELHQKGSPQIGICTHIKQSWGKMETYTITARDPSFPGLRTFP